MFSKKEISQLQGMLDVLKSDIREETKSLIAASENRMTTRLSESEARLTQRIEQVSLDVAEVLDTHVLPNIDSLDHRVTRIEKHVNLV